MSVGGVVSEVIVLSGKVWVNTLDGRDECAIYVENTPAAASISVGDRLWWQGSHAFWTPVQRGNVRPFSDKQLKRLGFSGVSRPAADAEAAR